MASILSYLARAAPGILARGQQGRMQGEEIRRQAAERQAQRDALLQREMIRRSLANFNRVQAQQFQTNRDVRTRAYNEQQATAEREREQNLGVASLRAEAKTLGIPDADAADPATLRFIVAQAREQAKRDADLKEYEAKRKLDIKYRPPKEPKADDDTPLFLRPDWVAKRAGELTEPTKNPITGFPRPGLSPIAAADSAAKETEQKRQAGLRTELTNLTAALVRAQRGAGGTPLAASQFQREYARRSGKIKKRYQQP